jgi:hypothetical protein
VYESRVKAADRDVAVQQDLKRLEQAVSMLRDELVQAADLLKEAASKRKHALVWLVSCRGMRRDIDEMAEALRQNNQLCSVAVDMFERNQRFRVADEKDDAPESSMVTSHTIANKKLADAVAQASAAVTEAKSSAGNRDPDELEEEQLAQELKQQHLQALPPNASQREATALLDNVLSEQRDRVQATADLIRKARRFYLAEKLLLDMQLICSERRYLERKLQKVKADNAKTLETLQDDEKLWSNRKETFQRRLDEAIADCNSALELARKLGEENKRNYTAKLEESRREHLRAQEALQRGRQSAEAKEGEIEREIQTKLERLVLMSERANLSKDLVGARLVLKMDTLQFDDQVTIATDRVTRRREQLQYSFWMTLINSVSAVGASVASQAPPAGAAPASSEMTAMNELVAKLSQNVQEVSEYIRQSMKEANKHLDEIHSATVPPRS